MLEIHLDEQLEARLSALADKTNRSRSSLAAEALARYIDEEERKQQDNEFTVARWEEYQDTSESVEALSNTRTPARHSMPPGAKRY